jgi:glycosyltransferase involved in cell wall biosynthesis
LPHKQLGERMRTCDLLILPSLEDGFARTVTEGLACGLPVITTPNTGASEWIRPGVNGEVVPIRDPQAIADAVFKWADKILSPDWQPSAQVDTQSLTAGHFEQTFIGQLAERGLA